MNDVTYNTYSAKKPSFLARGITYGVSEMLESGSQMGMQQGRKTTIDGFTGDMEDGIMQEMLNDGLNSAMSTWTGGIMQVQEQLLDKAFIQSSKIVAAWYGGSVIKNQFQKFRKGRKASMFSKVLAGSDKKAEECRLMADFAKMDMDASANAHNPQTEVTKIRRKQDFEAHEVNKEGVRTRMAKLQLDGLTRSFDWKLKTSSFTSLDKSLIKDVTGIAIVTDDYIDKLNSQSQSMSFKDSEGNWIGGNQVTAEMLNYLNTNKIG